jgi:hypothetical protein
MFDIEVIWNQNKTAKLINGKKIVIFLEADCYSNLWLLALIKFGWGLSLLLFIYALINLFLAYTYRILLVKLLGAVYVTSYLFHIP